MVHTLWSAPIERRCRLQSQATVLYRHDRSSMPTEGLSSHADRAENRTKSATRILTATATTTTERSAPTHIDPLRSSLATSFSHKPSCSIDMTVPTCRHKGGAAALVQHTNRPTLPSASPHAQHRTVYRTHIISHPAASHSRVTLRVIPHQRTHQRHIADTARSKHRCRLPPRIRRVARRLAHV
jgi:hypothetical protein